MQPDGEFFINFATQSKKIALRHSSRADAEHIIKKLILLRYMSF